MLLNQPGQTFMLENTCICIGQEIVANGKSIYAGLSGVVTEIRDGDDKETENPTVDVYCDFTLPDNDYYCAVLERRFEAPACEIPLEQVVMAPEMIEPKAAYQINPFTMPFYVLTYCVDTDSECNTYVLAVSGDIDTLKQLMNFHIENNEHIKKSGGLASLLDGFDVSSFDTKSVPDDGKRFIWTVENNEMYIGYTISEAPFVLPAHEEKESVAEC